MNTHGPTAERLRRGLERFIFAALVALVVLVVVPYGSVDPLWEGVFECAAFALGALWVTEGALGARWLVAEHRLLAPVVCLFLFMLAQAAPSPFGATTLIAGVEVRDALSADPFETVRAATKLAALAVFFALLVRYTSSERRLRVLCYAVVFAGLASALFGIYRQTAGAAGVAFLSPRLAANADGYAQFINRNHFAFLAEMALGVALGLALGARRERLPAHLALALPVWAALVLSNSRGGVLGMFGLLVVLALLYFAAVRRRHGRARETATSTSTSSPTSLPAASPSSSVRATTGGRLDSWLNSFVVRAAMVCVLLVVVAAGVVWVNGERLAARMEAAEVELSTGPSPARWGDRRPEIWAATWRVFREHPIAGVGFGAYRAAITRHHDASGEMALEQAHNDYLELLASGGLIGAALAAWFVASLLRAARRKLRGRGLAVRAVRAGALAGLGAIALHSLFDFGLHVTANAVLFVALAAVAVVDAKRDDERRARDDEGDAV